MSGSKKHGKKKKKRVSFETLNKGCIQDVSFEQKTSSETLNKGCNQDVSLKALSKAGGRDNVSSLCLFGLEILVLQIVVQLTVLAVKWLALGKMLDLSEMKTRVEFFMMDDAMCVPCFRRLANLQHDGKTPN